MHSKERGYEQESRVKVRPLTFNGYSDSCVPLSVDYSPIDTLNNTETKAI